MRSEATVLGLVGLIYDAAGDASKWPAFLGRLGDCLNSRAVTLYVEDLHHHLGNIAVAVGFDREHLLAYERYYRPKNIYLMRGRHLLWPGNVCQSQMLCADAEVTCTEFYNDFVVPQRLTSNGLNGVILKDHSTLSMLGLIRQVGTKPYSERDVRLLQLLMPHLQRAVQLHQRITSLEIEKQAASDALNRWSLGVILLDAQGRILLVNRSAEAILNEHDGLSIDRGELRTAQPNKTAVLRNLIHGAIQTSLKLDRDPGGALTLPRPSGKRPLNVLVTPACSNHALFPEAGAAVAVFVSDPDSTEASSEDLLRQLYGLSRAEANAAVLLMDGTDVSGIAEKLGIALNTARTHVRRILAKTGTKRQGELIALLYKSPAALRGSLMKNHQFG